MPTVLMLADGASIHTARWANAIAGRGWHVHLYSLRPPGPQFDDRVAVHLGRWSAPHGYFLNVSSLRKIIRRVRPDIVHAHYATGYGTLGALVDEHPLVTSVWGSDVFEFPRKSPVHAALLRRNLRASDVVLSTSRVMAEEARRYMSTRVGITPFGVDLAQFRPQVVPSPFARGDIVVGTVKSLAQKYGIDDLIRACAIVKKRHPHLPVKLLVVGDGGERNNLERLAIQQGIASDTLFVGSIPHDRVPHYHNMLSIAVFVSRMESFGVAVAEASACEKPVVVSNVGGLPEVVQDGVTGMIVPARDPIATAAAIEKLALDEALRKRMGAAGRVYVERMFEWGRCVDAMFREYHALIGRSTGAGLEPAG